MQGPNEGNMLWRQRLKIRPDHGAPIVVSGMTIHSRNAGKQHAGRRGAGFPIARKNRGAHSATTNDPACNTEQNGPEARGAVRYTLPKALQRRTVAAFPINRSPPSRET